MQVAARGLLGFGGLGALGCLLLGTLASRSLAEDFGLWTSGLSAVLAGALVVVVGSGRIAGQARETFRMLLGGAVLLWGVGEVMLAVDLLNGPLGYPAPGDLVSALGAPLGVIALIRAPRSSRSDWPGVRLGLDALLLAAGITMLLWRTLLIGTGEPISGDVVINAGICFADAALFGIVLLVCLRDTACRLWPAIPGLACEALADLTGIVLSSHAETATRVMYWQSMALWSLAWPLIAIGLVRFRRSSPTADSDGARDRQEVVAGQITVVLTFLAVAVGLIVGRPHGMDARAVGTLVLFSLLGVLLLTRELINAYLRLRLAERLRAQAFRDELTGLPNRRALMHELNRLFSLSERAGHPVLIAFIDLDGFKVINDTHGHEAGDLLLVTLARQLSAALRGGDLLARVGGDEFVAVGMGPHRGDESIEVAVQRFQRRLFEQSVLQLPLPSRVLHYPGASVGVVAIDPAHTSIDDALRQADARMYAVKRQRRTLG